LVSVGVVTCSAPPVLVAAKSDGRALSMALVSPASMVSAVLCEAPLSFCGK